MKAVIDPSKKGKHQYITDTKSGEQNKLKKLKNKKFWSPLWAKLVLNLSFFFFLFGKTHLISGRDNLKNDSPVSIEIYAG